MSVLMDARGKLLQLIQEIEKTDKSYVHARSLFEQLEQGQDVDMSGLGMNIVFDGGSAIPVPLPDNREQMIEHAERAANFLGSELVRLWDEVYKTATEAKNYCDNAAAQAAQAQQQPPPQTTPVQPQQPPPQQQPQQPPQQQTQPRVHQVTTPVG